MYPEKIIVHLSSICQDIEQDFVTIERLAAEIGETLSDTAEGLQIAIAKDWVAEDKDGHLWPSTLGRIAASSITRNRNNTKPQPEYQQWMDEARTGITESGKQSNISCAAIPSGSTNKYSIEKQLEARSELDKFVTDISKRLKIERKRVLLLLHAGGYNQPIGDRGILLCSSCKEWQVVKWNGKKWHNKCIKCEGDN